MKFLFGLFLILFTLHALADYDDYLNGCSKNSEGRIDLFSGCIDTQIEKKNEIVSATIDYKNSSFQLDKDTDTYAFRGQDKSVKKLEAEIWDVQDPDHLVSTDQKTGSAWAPIDLDTGAVTGDPIDPDKVNTIKEAQDLFNEYADENDTDDMKNIDDLQKQLEEELPIIKVIMVIVKILEIVTGGPGAVLDEITDALGGGMGGQVHEQMTAAAQLTHVIRNAIIAGQDAEFAKVRARVAQEKANDAAELASREPTPENIAEANRLQTLADTAAANRDTAVAKAEEEREKARALTNNDPEIEEHLDAADAVARHKAEEAAAEAAANGVAFKRASKPKRKVRTIQQNKVARKQKKTGQAGQRGQASAGDGGASGGATRGSGHAGDFRDSLSADSFKPQEYFGGSYDSKTFWAVADLTNKSRSKTRDEPNDSLLGALDSVISGDFAGDFSSVIKNW